MSIFSSMTTVLPASAAVTAAANAAPPEPTTHTSQSSSMAAAGSMPVSAFLRAFTSPPAWSTHSATAVAKAMDDSEAPVTVSKLRLCDWRYLSLRISMAASPMLRLSSCSTSMASIASSVNVTFTLTAPLRPSALASYVPAL